MFKFDLKDLILLGLLIYIILMQTCTDTPIQPAPHITIQRDTMPPIIINLPAGKPTVINNPIPANIDSFQIAQAYFASVFYQDTIRTDSAEVVIQETVSRNAIQTRTASVKFNFPTSTTITEIPQAKQRNKVYLGGSLSYTGERLELTPSIAFSDKRDRLYFAGYSFTGGVQVGAFLKVKLRKD